MERAGVLRLGQCTFDPETGTLVGADGGQITLRNKSLRVLDLLARNANAVVTKDEIIDAVWSRIVVSDESLTQCIKDIRRAIGDRDRAIVKTLVRRGFMLVAEGPPSRAASVPLVFVDRIRVRDRSETVLNLAEEVHEGILCALSSRKGAKVTTDPAEADVADYRIEGNARQSGNHLRIFVSLTDREGDGQFYTERFESEFGNTADFAAVVAQKVTNVLRVSGIANFGRRFLDTPDDRLDAQQILAKAAYHYAKITPEATQAARATLQALVDREPDNAMALSMLAATAVHMCPHVPHAFSDAEKAWAFDLADRAIYLAPEVDYVFRTRGNLKLWLSGDHEAAVSDCLRALEITPYFQLAHLTLAEVDLMSGAPEAARERMETMMTVEPYLPQFPFFLTILALSHILEGTLERAQAYALDAFARAPWQSWNRLVLLTAFGGAPTRHDAALREAATQIDLPTDHFATLPFRAPGDLRVLTERLRDGLALYARHSG